MAGFEVITEELATQNSVFDANFYLLRRTDTEEEKQEFLFRVMTKRLGPGAAQA
jgi:hypothetical protein